MIELVTDPIASSLGDFAAGNDEGVIGKDSSTEFRIEDLMAQHHEHLIVNFSNIGLAALVTPEAPSLLFSPEFRSTGHTASGGRFSSICVSPEKTIHRNSLFLLNNPHHLLDSVPTPTWGSIMPTTAFRCWLLLPLAIAHGGSNAASALEQVQLSLALQQLDTIERLATRAETARTAEPDARYRFDYPRLTQDLQRIRQGVQGYLSPSRAQPRDPAELVGDYRLDTLPAELSP